MRDRWGVERQIHEILKAVAEGIRAEAACALTDGAWLEAILTGFEAEDSIGNGHRGLLVEEQARILWTRRSYIQTPHGFERSALAEGDHRTTAGLRLDDRHAEVFLGSEKKCPAVRVFLPQGLLINISEEFYGVAGLGAETSFFRSCADDAQFAAKQIAGLDEKVNALIRHKASYGEIGTVRRLEK